MHLKWKLVIRTIPMPKLKLKFKNKTFCMQKLKLKLNFDIEATLVGILWETD